MAQVAQEMDGGTVEKAVDSASSWDWTKVSSTIKSFTGDAKAIVGDIKDIFSGSGNVAKETVGGGRNATTVQSGNMILLAVAVLASLLL